MRSRIPINHAQLADLCRRWHVSKLSLFGSVLRDDFRSDSDVDVLVEFLAGQVPGIQFQVLESELSTLLARRVDLNTPGFLSHHFRDEVLREAEVHYVAA